MKRNPYNVMAGDMAALHARIAARGLPLRKEAAPSLEDIKKVQDNLMTAFETFKEKNDARLAQMEKAGSEDVVTQTELKAVQDEIIELRGIREELDKIAKRASRPGGSGGAAADFTPEQMEHREAFITMVRNPDDESAKATLQEIAKKAVTTTTDTAGGYAVPEIIAREVLRELAEISPIRDLVHVVRAGSKDYKELVDVRGLTYGWVGEGATRTETGTPGLEQVAPTFGMLYAYPKASEESLDDMFFDVSAWLVDSIVEGFAAGEENAVVLGNGTNKPTGFLNGTPTNEADGTRAFGTLQYKASGAAAAIDDADKFIDLVQVLKKGYRGNAHWLMNKLTVGTVMKLKDGDGNYLWKMGDIQGGQPDRLLGYPVAESEEMPDIAADAFPIAFGDFKAAYVLADLVGFRMTRDDITEPGFVKWYARRRLGGAVRKSEALKLIKVATS